MGRLCTRFDSLITYGFGSRSKRTSKLEGLTNKYRMAGSNSRPLYNSPVAELAITSLGRSTRRVRRSLKRDHEVKFLPQILEQNIHRSCKQIAPIVRGSNRSYSRGTPNRGPLLVTPSSIQESSATRHIAAAVNFSTPAFRGLSEREISLLIAFPELSALTSCFLETT